MKVKIYVWYYNEDKEIERKEVKNKRPQPYMYSWSFIKALRYIKDELFWMNVDEESVIKIDFQQEGYWIQSIVNN